MYKVVQIVFDALGEPNRRAILGLLAERELSVGQLEAKLELPQPLISKHLRVLRDSGFVEARVEAQSRVYTLRPEPLQQLDRWLEPYRRFWNRHLDALERHLDRMPEPSSSRSKPSTRPGARRSPTARKVVGKSERGGKRR